MTTEHSRSFGGPALPLIAVAGGAIAVVVLGLAVGLGVGAGGNRDVATQASSARPSASVATTPTTTNDPDVPDEGVSGPAVFLTAFDGDGFPPSIDVLDELPPSAVLEITARGFESNDTGFVEQCAGTACTNSFPVTFDARGVAHFQYLLHEHVGTSADGPSTCRANAPPCFIRVRTDSHATYARAVVRDAAPPAREVMTEPPLRDVDDDDLITVSVRNFPPGERVRAVLCAAPDTAGTTRCGAPGPVAHFVVGPDGRGSTTLVVRRGVVGVDRVACGREDLCGVVVQSEASWVPAPVAIIDFSSGPSARYDASRLAIGLAIALLLLVSALLLIRSTDWRKPTEADTPELDASTLSRL